ncbi:hypothetical protein [Arcanobacterium hippocoleae]|uniref:Uncharacterized protein n=1 Tax=Arcanobacterium hippocoleae TaxID=149017 RepID=A0ABU1SZM2_9ACTO|nr:hypothetical protein [Arcanobacterium hippocoleae]MDR6938547.1 hypothetical protein [Arcanobacterium hippocoleae]
MVTRTSIARAATSGLLAIALAFGTTGIASAQPTGENGITYANLSASEQAEILDSVDLSQEELETAAKEVELLFSVYLSQTSEGEWYVTKAGKASDVSQIDMEKLVSAMNGQLPQDNVSKTKVKIDKWKTGLRIISGVLRLY